MESTFDQFNAALLYCNKCGRAMPVRQRLLLVLPDGELYDYTCQGCNSSVGSKTEKAGLNESVTHSRSRSGGF
ncbi:MAG TPA: cytoplasmic protein [Candidatus Binatia bacterium]